MNRLRFAPLTVADLPAALALDQQCFGGLWSRSGYQRELDSPNSELWTVQTDRSPDLLALGCYWAIVDEAHITILAVAPAYRRQGLGRALLYQLLMSAQQRELAHATLEVRASNQAALRLYQQFGFQVLGRRKAYYPDNQEDAAVLWLKGLQQPDSSDRRAAWERQVRERLAIAGWELSE